MAEIADIHALEAAFAKHPETDAFVPLCEAYLEKKRYMEAMLVSKKGIKNLPSDPRGRLLLARVYLEQGKAPKAEQELHTLLEVFPDNIDGMRLQAEIFKQAGRKSEAIQLLQKIATLSPGRSDIKDELRGLGVEVDPPKQPPRPAPVAAAPFDGGGQAPPPRPQTPHNTTPVGRRGVSDLFDNDELLGAPEPLSDEPPRRASTFAGSAPKGNPGITLGIIAVLLVGVGSGLVYVFVKAQNVRKIDGIVREARPNFERNTLVGFRVALEKYQKILDIDSSNVFALSASAYIHALLSGEQLVVESKAPADKFLALANAAGDEKEENAYRLAARGMAKLYANDAKGAAELLDAALKKGMASPLIHLVLADAHFALGQEAETRDQLSRASTLSAADAHVLVRVGEGNLDDGKYDAAKGYFEQALNQESGHSGALIGRIFANLGRKQEALEAAEKDLEKLSSTPAEYLTPRWTAGMNWSKGLVAVRRNQAAEAQRAFDEANKIDPDNLRNLAVRGKVYAVQGMFAQAIADYQSVLAKRPEHRPSSVGLALAYAAAGKPADAMTLLDRLLAKDPNDHELLLVRARALKAQNKLDDAIAAFQKVLAAKSTSDTKFELAALYRQKRDFPKASELLVGMMKANEVKGRNLAVALYELGRTYHDQGDLGRAKSNYLEAVTKEQSLPEPYFFLAKLLKGKPQKEALARYLALAPGGPYSADAERLIKRP